MHYVLIIHEVEDYQDWKSVFNKAADIRKLAGERSYQVLKYESNPNQIVHFSEWTSTDDARAFFESPQGLSLLNLSISNNWSQVFYDCDLE
jgi:heme-degrading monooxygenase HmoA